MTYRTYSRFSILSLPGLLLCLCAWAEIPETKDLPLVEAPITSGSDTMVVILTGDGGWASIDREIAKQMNASGYSVVGFNCLRYFWNERAPDEAARDLNRTILHYAGAWRKSNALLIGYSMGADVMPFVVNRLPASTRERLAGVAMLAPERSTYFKVHVGNWLSLHSQKPGYPLEPEVKQMAVPHLLVVNGSREDGLGQQLLKEDHKGISIEIIQGGHHFDGDYVALSKLIRERTGLPDHKIIPSR